MYRKALRQALKDAPYNHLNKPNKNLMFDDDQDIKSQLEKRLLTSQWISRRLSNYNQDEVFCKRIEPQIYLLLNPLLTYKEMIFHRTVTVLPLNLNG